VIVLFVDIGGIVDHHCLQVIVRFVDIGEIVDHHRLNTKQPIISKQ
jgi:inorganic pyrophosphatase/exopolyphosphatase